MYYSLTEEEQAFRKPLQERVTVLSKALKVIKEQLDDLQPKLDRFKHAAKVHRRERICQIKARVVYHQMLAGIKELSHDPVEHAAQWKVVCRQIGNFIFDQPAIWTGYESKALKQAKKKGAKASVEHFFPRQRAGDFIASEYVQRGMKFQRFFSLVRRFRLVHHTTSEENSRLQEVQKNRDETASLRDWRKEYKMCDVVLEKPDAPRHFWLTPSLEKQYAQDAHYYEPLKEVVDRLVEEKREKRRERALLNKSLKRRATLYQRARKLGYESTEDLPFHMLFDDLVEMAFPNGIPINNNSVEGDDLFTYDTSSHGQLKGTDREQKQSLERKVQEANA